MGITDSTLSVLEVTETRVGFRVVILEWRRDNIKITS